MLPAAQGSLCEPFRVAPQEAAGRSPSMGPFRPQLSGKHLCFLPPSHSGLENQTKQAGTPPCTRTALQAGGSTVRASQLLQFLPGPQLDHALAG